MPGIPVEFPRPVSGGDFIEAVQKRAEATGLGISLNPTTGLKLGFFSVVTSSWPSFGLTSKQPIAADSRGLWETFVRIIFPEVNRREQYPGINVVVETRSEWTESGRRAERFFTTVLYTSFLSALLMLCAGAIWSLVDGTPWAFLSGFVFFVAFMAFFQYFGPKKEPKKPWPEQLTPEQISSREDLQPVRDFFSGLFS